MRKIENVQTGPNNRPKLAVVIKGTPVSLVEGIRGLISVPQNVEKCRRSSADPDRMPIASMAWGERGVDMYI